MKKILSFFVLMSSICFADSDFDFRPLWKQDEHFQKYQCLMIEASIHRIESVLEKADANDIDPFLKSVLLEEIGVIKFNLGLN